MTQMLIFISFIKLWIYTVLFNKCQFSHAQGSVLVPSLARRENEHYELIAHSEGPWLDYERGTEDIGSHKDCRVLHAAAIQRSFTSNWGSYPHTLQLQVKEVYNKNLGIVIFCTVVICDKSVVSKNN